MTADAVLQQDPTAAREAAHHRRTMVAILLLVPLVAILLDLWDDPDAAHTRSARRTSFHKGGEGFAALHAVLDRLGFGVDRHLRSYAVLPDPQSSLLLVLDPLDASRLPHLTRAQVDAFDDWVRAGGHVLATLPAAQTWTFGGKAFEFVPGSGLDEVRDPLLATWPESFPARRRVPAEGRFHVRNRLEGAERRLAIPDVALAVTPAYVFTDTPHGKVIDAFTSDLAAGVRTELSLEDAPLIVSAAVGAGRIYLAASPLLFSNHALGRLGVGATVVETIDAAAGRGRRGVLFDEFVHGLAEQRGIWWWALNSELRYPFFTAILVAIMFGWHGMFRLGSPRPLLTTPRRAAEEYVISLADLSLRAGRRRHAAERILRAYAARIRVRRGLRARVADPTEPWPPELRALASELRSVDHLDSASLRDFVSRADHAYQGAITGATIPSGQPLPSA